ncbi:MAG: Ig-like domain-containing protein [Bacteroidota bacterium]
MKKILFVVVLVILGVFAKAQNGLQNITVEKYYISNAADAAASHGVLPVGSITYRIYADMLPGYSFQMAYGNANHNLVFHTTTGFFNNEDYGATTPNSITVAHTQKNTVMLDSWISAGGAAAGKFGVLKTVDTDGAITNLDGLLQNADSHAGIPVKTEDGMMPGTLSSITTLGLDAVIGVFDATSNAGNDFTVTNGAWSVLGGVQGLDTTNRVLIAQITTDGVFNYALNIQIGTPTGGTQNYVSSNPVMYNGQMELSIASLSGTLNTTPVVSITSPSNNTHAITGDVVAINATASYVSGTVSNVEFFVDGTSIGVDNTSPYSANYTGVTGTHILTAVATGNDGITKTSVNDTLFVAPNQAPTVSITSPVTGAHYFAPAVVTINATATDIDGTVASVQFFVNGVSIGTINSSPYTINWTSVIGTANITAIATDNRGATTTSSVVSLVIADPNVHYKVGSVSNSCLDGLFSLPVIAIDTVNNVIGYDIVMSYDNTKIGPTFTISKTNSLVNSTYYDISSYFNAAAGKINISLSLNANAPTGTSFHGVGNLFNVEFTKSGSFNSVDTTVVSVSSLQESYSNGVANKSVDPGKYTTYKNSVFNAAVEFWNGYAPIQYNAANPTQHLITNIYGQDSTCSNMSATAVQPDTLGGFTYNVQNGPAITINRDINDTVTMMSVLSAYDVYLAKKVITSDPSFVPNVYQIVAMDVNMDGVISAGDISQLNQRIIKKIPEFKQSWNYNAAGQSLGPKSKDWIFVDNSRLNSPAYHISSTYPLSDGTGFSKSNVPQIPFCLAVPINDYTGCPQILNETYMGILLGDIDGSYKNLTSSGTLKSLQALATDTVIFDVANAIYTSNNIQIPVLIHSPNTVNGLDFATKFNQTHIVFDTILNQTTYLDGYTYYNTTDSTLRYTATSSTGTPIQTNADLVMIQFHNLDGAINTTDLNSVTAYINGSLATIVLTTSSAGISENQNNQNVQIFPNPAKDKLNIEVSENSKVQMFDINGKQIVLETTVYANQLQSINVSNLANGVYMIKVINDKFVRVQKVVINK